MVFIKETNQGKKIQRQLFWKTTKNWSSWCTWSTSKLNRMSRMRCSRGDMTRGRDGSCSAYAGRFPHHYHLSRRSCFCERPCHRTRRRQSRRKRTCSRTHWNFWGLWKTCWSRRLWALVLLPTQSASFLNLACSQLLHLNEYQ